MSLFDWLFRFGWDREFTKLKNDKAQLELLNTQLKDKLALAAIRESDLRALLQSAFGQKYTPKK